MKKMFSIITPTFNVKTKIEKTIQSVISQKHCLCEHIIIDAQSTDGTLDIIKEYASKYPDVIKYISEQDKGIYDAMNKGIQRAEGEYLTFQGAGDNLRSGILEKLLPYLKSDLQIVYGQVYFEKTGRINGKEFTKREICRRSMPHQGMFYKKEIFKELGKYSLEYPIAADHVFNINCFADDRIVKSYMDDVIANFEGDGISEWGTDHNIACNLYNVIDQNLGKEYGCIFKESGAEFMYFIKYIDTADVIIVGNDHKFNNHIREYIEGSEKSINILDVLEISEANLKTIVDKSKEINDLKVIFSNRGELNIFRRLSDISNNSIHYANMLVYKEFLLDDDFERFIESNTDNKNVYIFGAGSGLERIYNYIDNNSNKHNINILGVLDNDRNKWGKQIYGNLVLSPEDDTLDLKSYFIIASEWHREIRKQLLKKGINNSQIINAY